MLFLDGARVSQADTIDNIAIESKSDDDATLLAGLHSSFVTELEHYKTLTNDANLTTGKCSRSLLLEKKDFSLFHLIYCSMEQHINERCQPQCRT